MSETEMNLDAKRLRKFGKTISNFLKGDSKFKKRKEFYVAMAKNTKSDSSYIVITNGEYFDVLMSSFDFLRNRYDSLQYPFLISCALKAIDNKKENKNFYIVQ